LSSATGQTGSRHRAPFWLRPFVAIERARGRQRLLLILIGLTVLSIPVSFIARHLSLAGLPDVGDPFDMNEFTRSSQVPDDQNAWLVYKQAIKAFRPFDRESAQLLRESKTISYAKTSPEVKANLEANREALRIWLEGTNKPDCLTTPVQNLKADPDLLEWDPVILGRLAILEATRLMEAGDWAGAWTYLHASLRFNLHLTRHARLTQWYWSMELTQALVPVLGRWENDPAVSAELLHQSLSDVKASSTLLGLTSDVIKLSYLATLHTLRTLYTLGSNRELGPRILDSVQADRPNVLLFLPGGRTLYWFFKYEPERSVRLLRLVHANWLSQCDKRSGQRAPVAPLPNALELYDTRLDTAAQAAARALDAATLDGWYESSPAAQRTIEPVWPILHQGDSVRRLLDTTRLSLATELYRREQGQELEDLNELVRAGYLDALPPEYTGEPMAGGRP